ncbi:MAG: GumC family protein [Alphaproteobacteria bacterium]
MKDHVIHPGPPGYSGIHLPLSGPLPGTDDVRLLLRRLARRRWSILGLTLLFTALAAIVVLQLEPVYRATTHVMIEARQSRVANVEEVLSGLSGERETIESELRVIASRALAEKAIARLGLADDPEFNRDLAPRSALLAALDPRGWIDAERWAEWQALLPPDLSAMLGVRDPQALPEEKRLEHERARVVDLFLDRLSVGAEGRSRVIAIGFSSGRQDVAARVANTVAELYLVEQLEAKYEATRLATTWLNERVGELRERVVEAEQAVEAFRQQAGLIEGKGVTVASQQVSELNTQLILARGERAEAEARLRQVQTLVAGRSGIESAAEVLRSPLIQRLKEQEAEVLRRAADLSQQYGARHPRMIGVRAELDDIRSKIAIEVKQIVQSLRNEAEVARAREGTLVGGLDALKRNMGRANVSEVRLRALEREAAASRALFENFLSRLKETTAQENLQQPDARIISRADVPEHPAFPRTRLMIAGSGLAALLLSVAIAFLLERLDPGFRSTDQIESVLGVPGLGLVPQITGLRSIGRTPEAYVVDRPTSAFAESLRTLHTALLLSNVDQPPKTVLVTSSVPREGKSTIAIAMARLMARSGRSVLLVDCDLRRPRAASALGLPGKPGLVEVLARSVALEEAVVRDVEAALDVLPAGERPTSPPDLFTSTQMRALLADLRERYDLIVIDSPPVLAVSEARILARLTDTTVFVIRWAATPREVAAMGVKQIRDSGAQLAGAVLSQVNVKKHARYSYGDSGYYYGAARRYYAN